MLVAVSDSAAGCSSLACVRKIGFSVMSLDKVVSNRLSLDHTEIQGQRPSGFFTDITAVAT